MKTLNKDEINILKAQPIDEPDRAKIKWRKYKHKIAGKRTTLQRTSPKHPSTLEARKLLEQANRDLTKCQECSSRIKINIHHINGNPYDNSLENLSILCWNCHQGKHFADESVIEFEDVPYADE